MPIFRFPFFYNPNFYNNRFGSSKFYNYTNNANVNPKYSSHYANTYNSYELPKQSCNFNKHVDEEQNWDKKNNSKSNNDEDYFFELFGIKLYFDDILLICLIFFLYQEGVKDDELFLSLVLLLLS